MTSMNLRSWQLSRLDGELSSPPSPLDTTNFMEPIENMHEDNLPVVLEVFQEDAFLDIEEQCNRVWFDLVDGMNMVPKKVGYKDAKKELTDVYH